MGDAGFHIKRHLSEDDDSPSTIGYSPSLGHLALSQPMSSTPSSVGLGMDHDHDDIPDNNKSPSLNGDGPLKKKARSRTISSLTAEQLARKRAHDRDAQRAIRNRTKNQITTLEDRVKELEDEEKSWKTQNEELQKKLEEYEALGLGNGSVGSLRKSPVQVRSSTESVKSDDSAYPAPIPFNSSVPNNRDGSVPDYGMTPQSLPESEIVIEHTAPKTDPGLAMSLDHICHSGMKQPNGYRQIQDSPYEYTARKRSIADLGSAASDISNDIRRRISASQSLLASQPALSVLSLPSVQYPGTYCVRANGHWEVMPRHLPPTCILDRVYLEFLEEQARVHRVQGTKLAVLAGPPHPDVTYIVSPNSRPPLNGLTQVMTAIIDTFGDLVKLPERVGLIYITYAWMRWAIHPTVESYDNLPEFIKPRPSQLFTARPIWFDHFIFPMARDIMARNPQQYNNTDFSIPYTETVSVNWPYAPITTVIENTNSPGEYLLNPEFEKHIRNLDNWSVGSKFAKLFPELAPHVKVIDHPRLLG